jgi:hypothetical protein
MIAADRAQCSAVQCSAVQCSGVDDRVELGANRCWVGTDPSSPYDCQAIECVEPPR